MARDYVHSNVAARQQEKNNVYAKADPEHWRRKYFDALKSLESEERSFRSLESLLRRIVNRLCFAAMGLAPQLDAEVNRLSVAMRNKAGEADLEKLFMPLSDAIAALDQRKGGEAEPGAAPRAAASGGTTVIMAAPQPVDAPPPAEEIFGDDRVRAVLDRLLTLVRKDESLAAAAAAIDARLEVSLTREQLPVMLSDVADLLSRRITTVEREKQEVETLLAQITERLDELTRFLVGESAERRQSLENSQDFNSQLAADMHELGSSVESGADLVQVKLKVRTRLDTISSQMQEFRAREEARSRTAWERSEQMRERVELLEGEARKLQDKLRDEQRLAMVDALTQIPNRLAYDHRIIDEFKRWQRFGLPTCICAWDIDYFKRINDTYGHRAGDKVLRIVAECLAGRVRETDFVARYGGEEFVMILAGTHIEDGLRVVDQLRESVAKLGFHFRGVPVSVSISCGITEFQQNDTVDEVFDRADKALYRAKTEGRDRCLPG